MSLILTPHISALYKAVEGAKYQPSFMSMCGERLYIFEGAKDETTSICFSEFVNILIDLLS